MSEIDEWTAEMWEQADECAVSHLNAVYQLDREVTCKTIYTFYVADQRVYRANKAAPWSGTTYYNKMKTYLKNRLFQHERARVIEDMKMFYPAGVPEYRLTTVFNRVYTKRIDALIGERGFIVLPTAPFRARLLPSARSARGRSRSA